MKWEDITLEDISSNIQTGPFGSQLHQSDYAKEGTPVVMPKDLIDGHISEISIARVEQAHVNRLQQHKIQSGDLLFSRRGDVGRCAFATEKEENWLCGTGCLRVTLDQHKANPKFVFYQLQLPQAVEWFAKHAIGSTMLNLNTNILSQSPIKIPSLQIQTRIADILSSYDDLIENNQKQIALLEEAAQRLYKEWFVDLRFLGHESVKVIDGVPEGWKNVTIGDVIAHEIGGGWGEDMPTGKQDQEAFVIRGTDFYAITHGAYMNIPFRYHSLSNLKERTLMDNDILFEVSGGSKTEGVAKTVLIKQELLKEWNKPVICASFCKLIRLIDNSFSQYLFDHLQYLRNIGKTEMYDKRSASSIVNYRWKDFLTQEKMLLPSRKVLLHYNESAETIYKKIINCSRNIKTAQEARDRLLPKLMSGELEV